MVSVSGNTATLRDASGNGTYSIWLADTLDASSMYVTGGTGTSITAHLSRPRCVRCPAYFLSGTLTACCVVSTPCTKPL
ncbi:MAG: hypothetical protein R3B47_21550 [Bacteroidia bacterium]